MRERMERLVLLPFSVGCVSESSVAVAVQGPRRSKPHSNPSPIRIDNKIVEEEDDDESLSGESTKSSLRSLSLPKPNISPGIHRLFKGFKNFSQYFVYKEEMEELEMDMEIGGPTDVKHVTHIGWDGSATNDVDDAIKGWENLISSELLSVPNSMPSNPWRKSFDFNINMAKQVQPDHIHPPLVNGSAS